MVIFNRPSSMGLVYIALVLGTDHLHWAKKPDIFHDQLHRIVACSKELITVKVTTKLTDHVLKNLAVLEPACDIDT